jgi:hypothetical protein
MTHECIVEILGEYGEAILHHGTAVTRCFETLDGRLFVEGGMGPEYGNQVNFCPFCGFAASVSVKAENLKALTIDDFASGMDVDATKW